MADLGAVAKIYDHIHDAEEAGQVTIGWQRGIYPTIETAREALKRQDLFVLEDQGKIPAAAIINQAQVTAYVQGNWEYVAEDKGVMVLHTEFKNISINIQVNTNEHILVL